MRSAAFYVNFD